MLVIPRWFAIAAFTGVWAELHSRTEDELLLLQAGSQVAKKEQNQPLVTQIEFFESNH